VGGSDLGTLDRHLSARLTSGRRNRAASLLRKAVRSLHRSASVLPIVCIVTLFCTAPLGWAAAPLPEDTRSTGQLPRDTASSRLLILHNAVLGEITVTFGPNGEPSVPKGALIDMMLPLLDADPDLLYRMQSLRDWDGNVSLDAVEKAGFVVELDRSHLRLSRATIAVSPPPKPSARPGTNQSLRESLLNLTVTSGTTKLGGMTAQVVGPSTIRVPKAALIDMLSPLFDAATVASIERLPDVRGQIALTELEASGFLVKIEGSHLDITRRTASAGSSTKAGKPAQAKTEEEPIGSAGRLALVVHNGDVLGEVQVRSNSDNEILLTKSPSSTSSHRLWRKIRLRSSNW
jgi:hypothetical protein